MDNAIILIAVLKANEDKKQNLKDELLKLVTPSKEEPGCLDYEVFELKEMPGTFYVKEAYKDQAAFESHMESGYLQSFIEKTKHLLAEPFNLIWLNKISQ